MSQWRFNDVRVKNNWILRIFAEKGQLSNFRHKSQEYAILMGCLAYEKKHNYYNIHRKFQVRSTFCGSGGNHPPVPNFDSLPLPLPQGREIIFFFCAKLTGKDNPTINKLMVELWVLADRKNP